LDKSDDQSNAILFNLAQGFVGIEGAIAFVDFRKSYDRQVTIEHILDEGRFDKVKDWGINEHIALIEKFDSKDIFANRMNRTQIQNLVDYLDMIPSECTMKLWQMIGAEGANDDNMLDVHASSTTSGTPVTDILVRMYEG
jgi:hypothetical protein